jgi:hypothetical protein
VAVCLCSKKASLSDRSELFACDKHHMLRTVGEKTLAEKMYDEQQKKDKESLESSGSWAQRQT